MNFIVLSLLSFLMASMEFHLDKQLPLCCMRQIRTITPLIDGGIAVEAVTPTITILNGVNFSSKIAELWADDSITKVAISLDGNVYFADQSKIIKKTTKNQANITFDEDNLESNMIFTNKYALIGQRALIPIIKRIDIQKLKIQTYELDAGQNKFNSSVSLRDLKNGQIAFGQKYTIYLLNNITLQMEQQLLLENSDISSITSIWDGQKSVIMVQQSSKACKTYHYNLSQKKFQQFSRFYSSATSFFFTSPNTAVSVYQRALLYWQDFDQHIIVESWAEEDYIGPQLQLIALSNSQHFFVMASSDTTISDNKIQFFTLGEDYKTNIVFIIQKSQGRLLSAQFSEDDAYFLYNVRSNTTQINTLSKLDMVTKNKEIMMDGTKPANTLSFLVIKNRLIVFINRTTQNTITFYIQMRNISNFSLIFQKEVKLDMKYSAFKLLGNNYWNSYFILIIQTDTFYKAVVIRFQISGNQLKQQYQQSMMLSISNAHACNKYMIYASGFDSFNVYQGQTMSLYTIIFSYIKSYSKFYSQGNLFIAQHQKGSGSVLYDFSQKVDSFQKGLFFKQYYNDTYTHYQNLILPKRGLYLFFRTAQYRSKDPCKTIYDLNKLPIKKWSQVARLQTVASALMQSPNSNHFVIYRQILHLGLCCFRQHDECDPQHQQKINYQSFDGPKIFISTNQKYLFFIRENYTASNFTYKYTIQIRLTTDITILVNQFVQYSVQKKFQSIDITDDEKVVVHFQNFIKVYNLEPEEKISDFGLESVDLFDVSLDTIGMAGKSATDPKVYNIIVAKLNNAQPLLSLPSNSLPKLVKISQSAQRVAIYDSNSTLSAWDVKSQKLIFSRTFQEVVSLKFIDDDKILLQFVSNVSIISLTTFDNSQLSIKFSKIAVNNDGTLIAALINSTNVEVFDASMNEIANFNAPVNYTIVDVGFSPNDEVYAVDSNGTLFILSPTPCPTTFINIDSICLCPMNKTNTTGKCSCNPNFTQKDSQCLCINGFTFDGNNCFCNANASITEGACICKPNFIREGDECLCVDGFIFDGNNCFCDANATVVGSMCKCKETFVPQGDKCVCADEFIYVNGQCIECSFMCSSCNGSGTFDCTQYSSVFYIGIAGISVIVISLIVIIICLIKRRRMKASLLESNVTDNKQSDQNIESKNQSSLDQNLMSEEKKK